MLLHRNRELFVMFIFYLLNYDSAVFWISLYGILANSQAPQILRYLALVICNLCMVINYAIFLVSKESTQRDLSFKL